MHPDIAQGLVAKLLTSPTLLQDTLSPRQQSIASERRYPSSAVGEEKFDRRTLEQLRLFQSFIARVRHNPISSLMPRTFAVLKGLRIELKFFSDLTPEYMKCRAEGKLTLEQQVDLMAETAMRFAESIGCSSLGAIVRHEQLIQQSRRRPPWAGRSPESTVFAVDKPLHKNGDFTLEVYRLDIKAAISAVDRNKFSELEYIGEEESSALYRYDCLDCEDHLFVLDQFMLVLFAMVDGNRTARAIYAAVRDMMGEVIPEDMVWDFFARLHRRQIIS